MKEDIVKTGIVDWFEKKRGYGFIKPVDGSKDVFVHFSGIISEDKFKMLEKGQKVEFELAENTKGRIATRVRVVGISEVKVDVSHNPGNDKHIDL